MNRRRLNPRLKIQMVGLLMLLGMAALGFRLWWIQVAHGAEWTAQIRGSSQATVRIPSVRGEIKYRNGLTLVQNRASFEVDFYLPEMVKGYRERFGPPPLAEHRAIISGMPVQNAKWTIDASSNSGYYILKTKELILPGAMLSFGLSGVFTPGATSGRISVTTIITPKSGGEENSANNLDAEPIDFYEQ